RHHRQGHAAARLQRGAHVSELRSHPCRLPGQPRRRQGPDLQEVREGSLMATTSTREAPRLKRRYDEEVRSRLKDELGLGNIMEVPRFEKIVINMGVGAAVGQA